MADSGCEEDDNDDADDIGSGAGDTNEAPVDGNAGAAAGIDDSGDENEMALAVLPRAGRNDDLAAAVGVGTAAVL